MTERPNLTAYDIAHSWMWEHTHGGFIVANGRRVWTSARPLRDGRVCISRQAGLRQPSRIIAAATPVALVRHDVTEGAGNRAAGL